LVRDSGFQEVTIVMFKLGNRVLFAALAGLPLLQAGACAAAVAAPAGYIV